MSSIYSKLFLLLSLGIAWSVATSNRAAYFVDNDAAGSSVVAVRILDDGALSSFARTPTGGKGLVGLVAPSQDTVLVSQDYLFVVNPGDNTLSLFRIDPKNLLHPILVGKPAGTLGVTPISVAYSPKIKTACVVNAGSTAGVTCFSVDRSKGLIPQGGLRPLPQPQNPGAGLPIPGPEILSFDVAFNPSSSALFATLRDNGVNPGFIYAWPVVRGSVSRTPVVSKLSTLTGPFSLNFLGSDARLLITNAIPGATAANILNVSPSFKAAEGTNIILNGNVAECWGVYAPQFNTAYILDGGAPNVTALDPATGVVRGSTHFDVLTPGFGGTDLVIDRRSLYLITDDPIKPEILVFSLDGAASGALPKLVQHFDIFSKVGRIPGWFGLAIYPVGRST